jgi:hypothetical protein
MDTGSVVAVLHAVEGRWGRTRYDVLWLGKASLPNYRYPTPYPVRSQDWKAIKGDNGQALVSVRLAGKRWLLRLRGGEQFCRQLNSHTQLVDGRAVLAELSIYEQRANEADHRLGTNGRDSGGQRINSRVMVKMVGWFPRPPRPAVQEGVLFVMPSEEAMLVAVDAKANRLWTYHGDHIRRWVAEHARRRQSWSDDQKPEARQRGGPGKAASRRDAACLKQRRRLASAVKEIAAMVVSYAARRRFAEVRWVLADSHYLSSFPWAALRGRIQTKCNEVNIEYKETKHGDDATERPGV